MRSYTIDLADDPRARPGSAAPTAAESVSEEPVASASVEPEAEEAAAGESTIPTATLLRSRASPVERPQAQPRTLHPERAREWVRVRMRPPLPATGRLRVPLRAAKLSSRAAHLVLAPQSGSRQLQSRERRRRRRRGRRRFRRVAASGSESPAPRASTSKGWAVQLGMFASRENAERLAKEAEGQGFPQSSSMRAQAVASASIAFESVPQADRAAARVSSARSCAPQAITGARRAALPDLHARRCCAPAPIYQNSSQCTPICAGPLVQFAPRANPRASSRAPMNLADYLVILAIILFRHHRRRPRLPARGGRRWPR